MLKKYRVLTEKNEKKIEDAINQAVEEGWNIEKFDYAGWVQKWWALIVKEE